MTYVDIGQLHLRLFKLLGSMLNTVFKWLSAGLLAAGTLLFVHFKHGTTIYIPADILLLFTALALPIWLYIFFTRKYVLEKIEYMEQGHPSLYARYMALLNNTTIIRGVAVSVAFVVFLAVATAGLAPTVWWMLLVWFVLRTYLVWSGNVWRFVDAVVRIISIVPKLNNQRSVDIAYHILLTLFMPEGYCPAVLRRSIIVLSRYRVVVDMLRDTRFDPMYIHVRELTDALEDAVNKDAVLLQITCVTIEENFIQFSSQRKRMSERTIQRVRARCEQLCQDVYVQPKSTHVDVLIPTQAALNLKV